MGRARGSAFARIARPGGGGAPAEDDEDDDEPQETSVSDLTSEADPNQFDQTFTDSDAALTIQGAFDPVAGPKQVIPRLAYVINFNMVYNPERERWEPKKKDRLIEDWESGTTDNWTKVDGASGDTLTVVTSPVFDGEFSGRVRNTATGDTPRFAYTGDQPTPEPGTSLP